VIESAEIFTGCVDFFTGESLEIGRIVYRDAYGRRGVLLTSRSPKRAWRPTWVGLDEEHALQVPDVLILSRDVLCALLRAPRVPIDHVGISA
jgi:hypothetical protein